MHNTGMVTAEEVKKTRATLGESQAVFGSRFGIDQSTVHRWETDAPPKRGPGLIALRKLIDDLAQQAAE